MANKWEGAYEPRQGAVSRTVGGRLTYLNKGVQRARKAAKRAQADARNALTAPERRRKAARAEGLSRHSDVIPNRD